MQELKQNQNPKNESKSYQPFVFLFLLLVGIDQLGKFLALRIFKNPAFVFSLPLPTPAIYVIYFFVVAAMVYHIAKDHQNFTPMTNFAWTLIFAGAAGNILERMFLGYVRDFVYISFYRWQGIYNFADFFIIAGIILLIVPSLIFKHDRKSI